MAIRYLDHVQLAMPSGGESQAREFYGDILGLAEIEKPAGLKARGGIWLEIPGDRQVHLGIEEVFRPNLKAHPCFVTDGINDLAILLQTYHYPVVWDETLAPIIRFYSEDCFGNRLEFTSLESFRS